MHSWYVMLQHQPQPYLTVVLPDRGFQAVAVPANVLPNAHQPMAAVAELSVALTRTTKSAVFQQSNAANKLLLFAPTWSAKMGLTLKVSAGAKYCPKDARRSEVV